MAQTNWDKSEYRNAILADEMFKARKETIKIHFSKPFDSKLLDKSKSDRTWAKVIYQYIYSPEFMKGIPFEEYMKGK